MATITEPGVYHYREAERLTAMCVDADGNPPATPAPELDAYLHLAQVHATLAIAAALGALKEPDRAALNDWYEE